MGPILFSEGGEVGGTPRDRPGGDHLARWPPAYCLNLSGWDNSKGTAGSAGKTMSLFPVRAAPPAPAPPPAAIPIAAPLPPPARAPMIPPTAAPPPARTAVRLPFPFAENLF